MSEYKEPRSESRASVPRFADITRVRRYGQSTSVAAHLHSSCAFVNNDKETKGRTYSCHFPTWTSCRKSKILRTKFVLWEDAFWLVTNSWECIQLIVKNGTWSLTLKYCTSFVEYSAILYTRGDSGFHVIKWIALQQRMSKGISFVSIII